MNFLVYAILRTSEIHRSPLPCGIDERKVEVLDECGLAVVYSKVVREMVAPELARLLAFARAIADLGKERTILPVRYGNLLADENQARDMLRRKQDSFVAAMAEVDGCAEMSLRVLRPVSNGQQIDTEPLTCVSNTESSRLAADPGASDGLAYLLRRRVHFHNQDQGRRLDEEQIERFRAAFARLVVQFRAQATRSQPELSGGDDRSYPPLHFLVRRENLEQFRRAFRELEKTESVPMLLTGPWVPFNFVNLPAEGFFT